MEEDVEKPRTACGRRVTPLILHCGLSLLSALKVFHSKAALEHVELFVQYTPEFAYDQERLILKNGV